MTYSTLERAASLLDTFAAGGYAFSDADDAYVDVKIRRHNVTHDEALSIISLFPAYGWRTGGSASDLEWLSCAVGGVDITLFLERNVLGATRAERILADARRGELTQAGA